VSNGITYGIIVCQIPEPLDRLNVSVKIHLVEPSDASVSTKNFKNHN